MDSRQSNENNEFRLRVVSQNATRKIRAKL